MSALLASLDQEREAANALAMKTLESRIGYHFQNSELLEEAVTHPSLAYEVSRPHFDNQRLEFLGDAVLQLILTEHLFQLFPTFGEGWLTKLRSRLVSRDALCTFARDLGLGPYLRLGKGEASSGGADRPSNLADAFEALIGAVYLDGGYEPVKHWILSLTAEAIQIITDEPGEMNPKGQLQELLQALAPVSPVYRILKEEGPDHRKKFVAEVEWNAIVLGNGNGRSKKEAEIDAARAALSARAWESL